MDLRKYLGSQIKAFRKRAGISQEELGGDIGMAKNSIWRIETGDAWPEYANLEAMAAKLGVQPEAFFKGLAEAPYQPTPLQAVEVLAQFVKERAIEKPIQRQADLEAATRENQRLTEKVEELETILSQGHHLASRVARLCPEQQEELSRRLRQMEAAKAISSSDQESKPPSSPAARKPR